MPARVIRSRIAERDLTEIATWTVRQFGAAQARRYAALIQATLRGLRRAPHIIGARFRPELGHNVWTVRVASGAARSRHVVLFTWNIAEQPPTILVLRILHDSMDPTLHLPPDDPP